MAGPTSPEGKAGPPLRAEETDRRQVKRDRAADHAFVRAALPLLGAEARERAELVRLRPGDPVRELLA